MRDSCQERRVTDRATYSASDGVCPSQPKQSKLRAFKTRAISTFVLIGSFVLINYWGHVPLTMMIFGIQVSTSLMKQRATGHPRLAYQGQVTLSSWTCLAGLDGARALQACCTVSTAKTGPEDCCFATQHTSAVVLLLCSSLLAVYTVCHKDSAPLCQHVDSTVRKCP